MTQLFDIDKEMSWYAHDTDPAIVNQAKAKRQWKKWLEIGEITRPQKAVHQYDMNGKYIASFESSAAACAAVDCDKSGISASARNEGRYTASGYYWSYQIKELIVKK